MPLRSGDRTNVLCWCALVAALALTWICYRPGLTGGFLFDDFANLPTLGKTGPVDNAATFWRYITSGSADPTGRPIALLSFLIDANDWPADPYPFKRTGILLHLLNSALLFVLLRKLGRVLGRLEWPATSAALVGSTLWMLHPLFVSTTLYIVQRETMLPATFLMLGLIGFTRGRELARDGMKSGLVLSAISILACTVLATLSKANGVLLPLLVWLVDAVILAPNIVIDHMRTKRAFAMLRQVLLIAPSILLLAYLVWTGCAGFAHGMPAFRPWTLGERLLTEARVVVDYLRLLWFPRPYTSGLFNDAFLKSTSLLEPPTTLLCLLFVLGLTATAWILRSRRPAFAVAVLFFFVGQLLESTVVPLELYFEHRNYLPAMLMFWPIGLWISGRSATGSPIERDPGVILPSESFRFVVGLVLILGLSGMTYLRASLWGDERLQALVWAQKNPHSPRAQAYAAQIEVSHGQTDAAVARLERALIDHPHDLQLSLNLVGARCGNGSLSQNDVTRAADALRTAPNTGRLGYDWFERGLSTARAGTCRGFNLETLDTLLAAASENVETQRVPGRLQDRLHLQARIALLRNDDDRALDLFNAALDADIRPGAGLAQAAILATAHEPVLALRHLDHLERVWKAPTSPGWSMPAFHAWLLARQGYWNDEILHMRKLLAEDIANADNAAGPAYR